MTLEAIDTAAAILRSHAHGSVSRGGRIGPLTSYRMGGPAGVLLEAASEADLEALSAAVRETGIAVLIVGRGSNMLVSDRGFPGVAVRLGAAFRWARANETEIEAGAGMPLPALASFALQSGLAGLEFAVAIPASLGGAVRMNAGAHEREMSDVLSAADLFLLGESRVVTVPADEAGFEYRTSRLPADGIVTAARLGLGHGPEEEIVERMREARAWRRATQPLNLPNGGSVFKNPPGDHAARLIERVGGRGMRIGGARISEVHTNFIVAEEGARADDVYTLIHQVRRMVLEETGVDLDLELKLVGEFEEVIDGPVHG